MLADKLTLGLRVMSREFEPIPQGNTEMPCVMLVDGVTSSYLLAMFDHFSVESFAMSLSMKRTMSWTLRSITS